jgi:hypothetical protein
VTGRLAEGSSPADTGPGGETGGLQAPPQPVQRTARLLVQALAPARYRVQFTIGQETHDRLRRVQALLRRQVPSGDPAAIFDRALRLLEEVEGKKLGLVAKPRRAGSRPNRRLNFENRIRPGTDSTLRSASPTERRPAADGRSRHISAAVKRAVWFRDAGQCAFVSDQGRRCTERSFLELHHVRPYALDGPATVGNIALRCRRHNQYEGELVFGSRRSIAPKREHRVP